MAVVFVLLLGGAFGLQPIGTHEWGGLPLTLVMFVGTIVGGIPAGVLLALGRRSTMPAIRALCIGFIEVLRGNSALNGALSAITAAVVGVVLNLAIWFALHTMFREVSPVQGYGLGFDMPVLASVDLWALALSVAAIVAIFRFKVGMITTLLACSAVGIILHLAGLVA